MAMRDRPVLCECGNCDWRGDVIECAEIHGLLDRVEVGDEFPAGECPECGALAYLVREDVRREYVIVSVCGGVVDIVSKPAGMSVLLIDYDVDAADDARRSPSRDTTGRPCTLSEWAAADEVVSEARPWKCDRCGRLAMASDDDLAEVGTPFCTDCESRMTPL